MRSLHIKTDVSKKTDNSHSEFIVLGRHADVFNTGAQTNTKLRETRYTVKYKATLYLALKTACKKEEKTRALQGSQIRK